MQKSLDIKLANIHRDPIGSKDFILADAKDADMAAGLASPGIDARSGKMRSLSQYREQMREIVKQGLVDIMLMSASTSEILTIQERIFDNSQVTPAARANDTTDIHLMTGGTYAAAPSRPFQSTTIDHVQSGKIDPTESERRRGANLGLYSITPNNDITFDYATLTAYKEFRIEAERKGFRHFLEVFDPNACGNQCPGDLGRFINDLIVRTLAGVPSKARPIFLKIVYHGPRAMEELVAYDPHLVVGVLGGASGTTHDAFKLLEDAKKHGGRAALFGRKINNSEDQLTFVRYLRAIADGQIGAEEAVKAYHGEIQKLGLKPYRALKDDLELTVTASSYAGTTVAPTPSPAARSVVGATPASRSPSPHPSPGGRGGNATRSDNTPDFKKMTSAEKVAYARARLKSDVARDASGNGRR
jgi:hypothetical protein